MLMIGNVVIYLTPKKFILFYDTNEKRTSPYRYVQSYFWRQSYKMVNSMAVDIV